MLPKEQLFLIKMLEGEPRNDQSFEKAYDSLQEAIRPILTGCRGEVDILSMGINPWTGKRKYSLPSLPSASSETAHRAVETLKEELGYDCRRKWHEGGATSCFPTKTWEIVFTRRGIYEVARGDELIGEVWSIENLQPKGCLGVGLTKFTEIRRRIRRAIGLAQYYQG